MTTLIEIELPFWCYPIIIIINIIFPSGDPGLLCEGSAVRLKNTVVLFNK